MALVGASGENVKSVERIAQSTDCYTEADILAAFNAIETEFASEFEGCTLNEVRYDGEVKTRHLDEMLEYGQKGKGDLIVVLSEFTTDWRAADEGFSPNDRYEDW